MSGERRDWRLRYAACVEATPPLRLRPVRSHLVGQVGVAPNRALDYLHDAE